MPAPAPAPTPTPAESSDAFEAVPDAEAAARSRQEAENARRYAAERARQEAEEAEREAFRKRQEAAAALFEQPVEAPPTPLPGQPAPPVESDRWAPAPTPTPVPSAAAPEAQLPGAAEAKRFAPRPVAAPAPPKPGDLVCGNCGAGNDPARKFCRQCGASLVAAVVEPKLPWWKRIFKRNKKKVPPPQPTGPGRPASKRTQRKRTTRKLVGYLRMGLVVVALLAVIGIGAVKEWREATTDFVSCKKRQLEAVVKPPVKHIPLGAARANSEFLPDHPAAKAFDANPATFWQAAAPAPPPGTPVVPGAPAPPATPAPTPPPPGPIVLNVDFVDSATVRQIHFFPGLPKANNPGSQPTPKTIVLTFKNADGQTVGQQERRVLETNVAKEDQLLKVKAKKRVRSVEVTILDVFASQGGGSQVTISDVQFFGSPAQASRGECKVE